MGYGFQVSLPISPGPLSSLPNPSVSGPSAPKEAYPIFSKPEGLQRRLMEIKRFYAHAIFQFKLALLRTASMLIYLALVLFFAGLVVLL